MTPADLILCVDDEPDRYRRLADVADPAVVLVTDCPATFEFWLARYRPRILGVCLDHDMRHQPGTWFARKLRGYSIPVAITSMNVVGAARIAEMLREFAVPRIVTPCAGPDGWERRALHFFREREDLDDAGWRALAPEAP